MPPKSGTCRCGLGLAELAQGEEGTRGWGQRCQGAQGAWGCRQQDGPGTRTGEEQHDPALAKGSRAQRLGLHSLTWPRPNRVEEEGGWRQPLPTPRHWQWGATRAVSTRAASCNRLPKGCWALPRAEGPSETEPTVSARARFMAANSGPAGPPHRLRKPEPGRGLFQTTPRGRSCSPAPQAPPSRQSPDSGTPSTAACRREAGWPRSAVPFTQRPLHQAGHPSVLGAPAHTAATSTGSSSATAPAPPAASTRLLAPSRHR